jgi:hypothetical protein
MRMILKTPALRATVRARADYPTLPLPPRFGAWLEAGRDPVSGLMVARPLELSFFSSIAVSPTSGFEPALGGAR